MDSSVSDSVGTRTLRRSTRQSSGKSMAFEATPRGPLKRTRKSSKKEPPSVDSGSGDLENGIEDNDYLTKKRRMETEGDVAGDGHTDDMDVQTSELMEMNEDLEMDAVQDPACHPAIPRPHKDGAKKPHVVINERCQIPVNDNMKGSLKTVEHEASTKSLAQLKAPQKRPEGTGLKMSTMQDYKRKMEARPMSYEFVAVPTVNHHVRRGYLASKEPTTTRQRVNNIPTDKKHVQLPKTETKKDAAIKERSGKSSRGWCPWRLIFMLLLIGVAPFLAVKFLPMVQTFVKGEGHLPRAVGLTTFLDQLNFLQTRFPSQRPELWRRSKIHLEKHLKAAEPTEPVSLIFAAGLGAERTLRCLARGLAASYSSALNGSVLHLDGAGTAGEDSDQVKLDIDTQLRAAFDGDKSAAVIHRLEELPPGSTLIFYRYCDHENAAYKRVFLLFTVLLPREELENEQSLRAVEETVQDYLREKLVDTNDQVGYNKMDRDKFGGLWSRVSHLVLPVVWEREVEEKGC